MKRTILFCSGLLAMISSSAFESEDWSGVPVIFDSYGHKITRDGSFSTGEAYSIQSAWGRDNTTGEIYLYEACSCGDGNNISKQHWVVGTDKMFMKGAFLVPQGDPVLISSLEKFTESYVHGINWDGTRLCGYVYNSNTGDFDEFDPEKQRMSYLPIYCDIDPSSREVGEPHLLPTPSRDFFGLVPQYCTANWISDDGKTILGQVIDNSGYFVYPIVYRQNDSGTWSYILPSEDLLNPDNLDFPVWPKAELSAPQAENYIKDNDRKSCFLELVNKFQNGMEDAVDPYELLDPSEAGDDALMTNEEWKLYQSDIQDYNDYLQYIYEPLLEKYYEEFSYFIAHSTRFLQSSMAMNNAGTKVAQTKIVTRFSGDLPVEYQIPVLFDLETGKYEILGDEYSELQIMQILPDGTIIAATPIPGSVSPDQTPQHSYVYSPEQKKFIALEDYIKNSNPEVFAWMEEYLYKDVPIGYDNDEDLTLVYKTMTVTGLVAVSDDFTSISAGVDGWTWMDNDEGYFTYFISGMSNPNAGVNDILDSTEEVYNVYNLSGVKVMTTKNADDLKNLSKGLYIVNNKKVII